MVKNTHLVITCPATNYIAATFHPTIVHHAHQSLSNTATPELGMIPQGLKGNTGLHIAKGPNQSNQHSWVYQAKTKEGTPYEASLPARYMRKTKEGTPYQRVRKTEPTSA